MSDKNAANLYDDGNIPEVDLPKQKDSQGYQTNKTSNSVEPLPESTRPRKDGPGGD